ncbi:c-type cytochrome [Pseudomonas citronellolis]|uniref:c-type cytochrome n=1 Tax=Pseudomonas citronellolis TaxID=53408 RepID=UPI0009EDDA88|nr:cytochrome c [Pseudomonas citronellolis]
MRTTTIHRCRIVSPTRQPLLACLLALSATPLPALAQRSAEQVWVDTCAYCHTTQIGPELRGRQLPTAMIQTFARYGVRQMPAFRESEISDAELATLAEWLNHQPSPTNEEKPHAAP